MNLHFNTRTHQTRPAEAPPAPSPQTADPAVVDGVDAPRAGLPGIAPERLAHAGIGKDTVTQLRPDLIRTDGNRGRRYFQVSEEGHLRPFAYDPTRTRGPREAAMAFLRSIPRMAERIPAFVARVDRLANEVTDAKLGWALGRFLALESQQGILRADNSKLVNPWTNGGALKDAGPQDWKEASLPPEDIAFFFKQAMDREEPTDRYEFTSAESLHDHLPNVAHFMGTTLQEHVLQTALTGEAPTKQMRAVWHIEEKRHGNIMEAVYNKSRPEGFPRLEQQGINTKDPLAGAFSAESMMTQRAMAELAAGTAYMVLRANATEGSGTDLALQGIYQDEVLHYVMMSAVNRLVYGQDNRFHRLAEIAHHFGDFSKPDAVDQAIYERPSPLALFEYLYALNAIDARVDRYLGKLDRADLEAMVGKHYRTDAEVDAAVARGEHQRTRISKASQNPFLSQREIEELQYRFDGDLSVEERVIRREDIDAIQSDYRAAKLTKPGYWMRRQGMTAFTEDRREIGFDLPDGASIRLAFDVPGAKEPRLTVQRPRQPDYVRDLAELNLQQIGHVMRAESGAVVDAIERSTEPLRPEDIAAKLTANPRYQASPLRVQ